MDSIRTMASVGIAQLMVLSALVPVFADFNDEQDDHRRGLGKRHSHVVSHSRDDYPVITNWLTSPDTTDPGTDTRSM